MSNDNPKTTSTAKSYIMKEAGGDVPAGYKEVEPMSNEKQAESLLPPMPEDILDDIKIDNACAEFELTRAFERKDTPND